MVKKRKNFKVPVLAAPYKSSSALDAGAFYTPFIPMMGANIQYGSSITVKMTSKKIPGISIQDTYNVSIYKLERHWDRTNDEYHWKNHTEVTEALDWLDENKANYITWVEKNSFQYLHIFDEELDAMFRLKFT